MLLLLVIALACWGTAEAQTVNPVDYANTATPLPTFRLYWNVIPAPGGDLIDVAAIVDGTGWAAFGIGARMANSDMMFAGQTTVTDRRGTGHVVPTIDAQDNLLSSFVSRTASQTHFGFRRALNSPDPLDADFLPGLEQDFMVAFNPVDVTPENWHGASNRATFKARMGGPLVVEMSASGFSVTSLSTRSGVRVSFRNLGNLTHRLTCTGCPEPFDSQAIGPGGVWARVFDATGDYDIVDATLGTLRMSVGSSSGPGLPPTTTTGVSTMHLIHAVLLSVAWGICAPVGIFFALIDKSKTYWFPIHWLMGAAALLLTLVGMAVIIYDVQIGSGLHFWMTPGSPTSGAHGTIGLAVGAAVVLQVSLGILIDCMYRRHSDRRHGWELAHHWIGRVLLLLAFAQLILGVVEMRLPLWAFAPYAVWLAAAIGVLAVKMIYRYWRQKDTGGDYVRMDNHF